MAFTFENKTDPHEIPANPSRGVKIGAELPPMELEDTFPHTESGRTLEMANATAIQRKRRIKRGSGGGGGGREPEEDNTRTVLYGFRYAIEGILGFIATFALSTAALMAGATLAPPVLFFLGLGALAGRMLLAGWIQPSILKQVFFAAGGLVAALALYSLGLGVVAAFSAFGGIAVVAGVAFLGVALLGGVLGFFDHKYKG